MRGSVDQLLAFSLDSTGGLAVSFMSAGDTHTAPANQQVANGALALVNVRFDCLDR